MTMPPDLSRPGDKGRTVDLDPDKVKYSTAEVLYQASLVVLNHET